jgi:hypothetical protein
VITVGYYITLDVMVYGTTNNVDPKCRLGVAYVTVTHSLILLKKAPEDGRVGLKHVAPLIHAVINRLC